MDSVGVFDAVQGQAGRRQLVCRQLGIGDCNGKQLLKSLNSYGFSRGEVEAAVAAANLALEEGGPEGRP